MRATPRLRGIDARIARRTGMLLFVVVRDQGGWRIAAAQNTEINRSVHELPLPAHERPRRGGELPPS